MKVVILAGGFGTRISEETHLKPKPMIEIGGMPIIWHIMKIYSSYGIDEFVICAGYKSYVIKEFFNNYLLHDNNVTFDFANDKKIFHKKKSSSWKVTVINTGLKTQTAGRLARVKKYLDDEDFCFTYGDGLSNVNLKELITFHKKNKNTVTLTASKPPGRFGALKINDIKVENFNEKPSGDSLWVNSGFFVVNPKVFEDIDSDELIWEKDILTKLAKRGELNCFKHSGFWQPMDTLRDKNYLEDLWRKNDAKWRIWK